MKKLFTFLALAIGLVSCQTEPEGFDVNVGGEQDVNITVSLPESTRAASNQGFDFTNFENNSDYDLRFILEISYNGKVVREVKTTETTSATFPVRLAPNKVYTFTVWADLVKEGTDDDLFYNTTDLKNITLKTDVDQNIRDIVELRDAYTHTDTFNFTTEREKLNMTLTRPFAKVRVVATDLDKVTDFGINPAKGVVEYTSDIHTSFNAVAGDVNANVIAKPTFDYNVVANDYDEVDEQKQLTVFADYIFVPAAENTQPTVTFTLDVKESNNGTIKKNLFNTAIPVERNKVTSIVGDVLTEGGNVNITIDGTLEEKETITLVDTAASLQEVIAGIEDGEEGNIQLGGDINLSDLLNAGILSTRAATRDYIYIAEGRTLTLDLNGFKISQSDVENKYAFNNHGTFIIKDSKGGGSINARGIYNGYGEGAENVATAKIIVESGVINAKGTNGGAAIYNYGVAEVKGGKFESNGGYGLNNQSGASMTITGGEIRGGIYNCGTLSVDGENTSVYQHLSGKHAIYNWSATATINNGAFDSESGNELILADGQDCSVTINGGTFDKTAKSWLMGAATGKNITFVINGGTFRGYVNQPEMTVDTFRPYGDPIVVCGGNFNFNPTQWLSDDYTVEADNGLWNVVRKPAVAMIDKAEYTSLAKAVAAIQDGETITLVANEKFTENNRYNNGGYWDGLGYAGDKNFTIDLNGYTISQNGALNDYLLWFKNVGSKANTITIKNGTLDAGTTAYCALCTASSHENELTINLENITLINKISNGSTIKVRAGSTLNVKAGTKIIGQDSYLGIENWNATVNVYEGAEIYMNGTSSYNGCLIGVGGNGVVNVYGGYGKGVSGGLIAMTSGGTINVSGGEWIANTDGTYANSNKSVLVAQSDKQYNAGAGNAVVNVTGGTFKGGYNCYGNAVGDAQINIKGGNFNANPASYVVAGYEIADENGIYTVRKPEALAKFEADIAKGGEVKLTEDITLLEPVVIESGKTVVLNLNGKTISGNWHKNNGAVITNNGTLTIVGGTISSIGENGGSAIQNKGTLTVNDATLNGAPNANGSWPSYSVNNIGVMTAENTIITSYHGAVASYGDGAVVTLNNCTIDMAGIPGFTSHGIYTYNNGKVVVNGGTYENKATDQAASGASVINGAVEVNAGTFTGRIENYYGTPVLKGGTFSVKPNAKFIAAGYEVVEENGRWIVREQ